MNLHFTRRERMVEGGKGGGAGNKKGGGAVKGTRGKGY